MTAATPQNTPVVISEQRLLLLISAVQFVNILDFMLVMPLGPDFASDLHVPLSQVGWVGGAYTAAAAVSGLLAAKFLDRFDRRSALAVTLVGLVIGTACGGLATDMYTLMAARVIAGCFGGPASALSLSIVADVVPPARRGRALGIVMSAFVVATVLGLPATLELARVAGWRSAFFAEAALGVVVAGAALLLMPPLRMHLLLDAETVKHHASLPLSPLTRGPAFYALCSMFTAMVAAFSIIPNISSYVQGNLHYPRANLGVLYLAGGVTSFIAMRLMGPVVDRFGSAFAASLGTAIFVTIMAVVFVAEQPMPVMVLYAAFMTGMAIRNVSLGAISSRVPLPHERARFMSLQSAMQHAAAALGAVISAQLLSEQGDHVLVGMPQVASLAIVMALFLPVFLRRIEVSLAQREALQEASRDRGRERDSDQAASALEAEVGPTRPIDAQHELG